jgi:hydrogenase maturation protease
LKTLVLGIGNPILGDDGVGFYVAQELTNKVKDICQRQKGEKLNKFNLLPKGQIDVKDASTNGLNLLEFIAGYDKVIIVDAIKTENGEVGQIYKLKPEDFVSTVHLTTSPHDTNLATAIKIGNELLAEEMPKEIIIFAVEVEQVTKFSEEMTKEVKEAIPKVANLVLEELV